MAEVEIRARYANQPSVRGLEPVQKRIEQDEIVVDGVRVGYVGTQFNAPLTMLFDVSEANMAAIREAVDKRDGQATPDRPCYTAPKLAERKGRK